MASSGEQQPSQHQKNVDWIRSGQGMWGSRSQEEREAEVARRQSWGQGSQQPSQSSDPRTLGPAGVPSGTRGGGRRKRHEPVGPGGPLSANVDDDETTETHQTTGGETITNEFAGGDVTTPLTITNPDGTKTIVDDQTGTTTTLDADGNVLSVTKTPGHPYTAAGGDDGDGTNTGGSGTSISITNDPVESTQLIVGDREKGRTWQTGESARDRELSRYLQGQEHDFRGTQARHDRTLTREQAQLQRGHETSERVGTQDWQSGESKLAREQARLLQGRQLGHEASESKFGREQDRLLQGRQLAHQAQEGKFGRDLTREQAQLGREHDYGMLGARERAGEQAVQSNLGILDPYLQGMARVGGGGPAEQGANPEGDLRAAQAAEFGRAADRQALLTQGGLRALEGYSAAAGFGDAGPGGAEAALAQGVRGQGSRALSDLIREQAMQALQLRERGAERDLTRRGQDVQQRGQDLASQQALLGLALGGRGIY